MSDAVSKAVQEGIMAAKNQVQSETESVIAEYFNVLESQFRESANNFYIRQVGNAASNYADVIENSMIGETVSEVMGGDLTTVAGQVSNYVMNGAINVIAPLMQAVGLATAILFFVMALIDLSSQDRLTMEFFVKFFSKFAIAVGFVIFSPDIARTCVNFGESLANMMSSLNFGNVSGNSAPTRADLVARYCAEIDSQYADTNRGVLEGVALACSQAGTSIIFWLVGIILSAITYVVGFSRILEMSIRAAFLPVAMGMMADDGWRGAGGRYIRKFIAICSQGAVLVLLGEFTNQAILAASISSLGEGSGGLVIILGIGFASVSMMFKSIGFINDVFGA